MRTVALRPNEMQPADFVCKHVQLKIGRKLILHWNLCNCTIYTANQALDVCAKYIQQLSIRQKLYTLMFQILARTRTDNKKLTLENIAFPCEN